MTNAHSFKFTRGIYFACKYSRDACERVESHVEKLVNSQNDRTVYEAIMYLYVAPSTAAIN